MVNELIAPRRPFWTDYVYDQRAGARHLRQWHRAIGYGEARFMSSTIRDEIIKCYEQYTHLCSGLGESMMHEIVRRYFNLHPERRNISVDFHSLRETPYNSPYRPEYDRPKIRR